MLTGCLVSSGGLQLDWSSRTGRHPGDLGLGHAPSPSSSSSLAASERGGGRNPARTTQRRKRTFPKSLSACHPAGVAQFFSARLNATPSLSRCLVVRQRRGAPVRGSEGELASGGCGGGAELCLVPALQQYRTVEGATSTETSP